MPPPAHFHSHHNSNHGLHLLFQHFFPGSWNPKRSFSYPVSKVFIPTSYQQLEPWPVPNGHGYAKSCQKSLRQSSKTRNVARNARNPQDLQQVGSTSSLKKVCCTTTLWCLCLRPSTVGQLVYVFYVGQEHDHVVMIPFFSFQHNTKVRDVKLDKVTTTGKHTLGSF